jgi:hypothetical protein
MLAEGVRQRQGEERERHQPAKPVPTRSAGEVAVTFEIDLVRDTQSSVGWRERSRSRSFAIMWRSGVPPVSWTRGVSCF